MSYRCNNCLYIFSNKHSNCPFCGGRIFENKVSDIELISDGFVQAPIPFSLNENLLATNNDIADSHSNKTNNIFEELQASYNSEHISNSFQVAPSINNKMSSEACNSSPKANSSISTSTEGGYFAQFTSDSSPYVPDVETSSTPPVISPSLSHPTSPYHNEAYKHEMQRLEAQQRRIQRDYNRLAVSNFFRNIQWRYVFRFLLILGIIIIAIVIWRMRYIIIESILNFLISLIPIVIIIAILWYFIKSFFK